MFATPLCHAPALLSFTSSRARFGPHSGLIGRRLFDVRMKARPNLGRMNERVKMRRWFHGAADAPLRRCAERGDVGLTASLERIGQARGRCRTEAIALSTAPYLIPVCLTRARLIPRPALIAFVVERPGQRCAGLPFAQSSERVAVSRQNVVAGADDQLHLITGPRFRAEKSARGCAPRAHRSNLSG